MNKQRETIYKKRKNILTKKNLQSDVIDMIKEEIKNCSISFRKRINYKEIAEIKSSVPELPEQKRDRLVNLYQLKDQDVEFFVQDQEMGSFFEEVATFLKEKVSEEEFVQVINLAVNYLTTDVKGLINKTGREIGFSSDDFAKFILLINSKKYQARLLRMFLVKCLILEKSIFYY